MMGILNFYIIISLSTLLFYLDKVFKTRFLIYEKIGMFFLLLVAGVRYNSGRDYLNYYRIYKIIGNGGTNFLNQEPGFYYLFKIGNFLKLSYQSMIFFISMFVLCVFYNRLIKRSLLKYRYILIFIFLTVNELYFNIVSGSALRQSIAISFFLLSLKYIKKKEMIKFILIIAVGYTFHNSIILMLPIYFIDKINKKIILFLVLLIPILYFFPNFLSVFLSFILKIFNLDRFSKGYILITRRNFSLKELFKNIFYIVVLFQYFVVYNLLGEKNTKYEKIVIKILLLGFVFKLYIFVGIDMFHRIIPYMYICYLPVISILLDRKKYKKNYIMIFFMIIFMIFHLKQIKMPIEFSKYYAKYNTVIGKSEECYNKDLIKMLDEENKIKKGGK